MKYVGDSGVSFIMKYVGDSGVSFNTNSVGSYFSRVLSVQNLLGVLLSRDVHLFCYHNSHDYSVAIIT